MVTKTIAFRVSEQDYNTMAELASRLKQMGQLNHNNPNLLAKEYTFAFANIVMKMNNWTQATEQDQAVFALARGMADTMQQGQGQGQGENK